MKTENGHFPRIGFSISEYLTRFVIISPKIDLATEFSKALTASKLNYRDHNETNLPKTIEQSVLKPLKDFGLISSYEKEEGLGGLKYIVHRKSTPPPVSAASDIG